MHQPRPVILQAGPSWSRLKKSMNLGHHWAYSILKMAAALMSVACAVIGFVLMCLVLFTDNTDSLAYIVNTFYAEQSNLDNYSWPVLPSAWTGLANQPYGWSGLPNQAPPNGQIFNHYYECMWVAQAGNALCANSTVAAYTTCVNTAYATNLSTCNAWSALYQAVWPTAGQYGRCIAGSFGLNRSQADAFALCLRTDLWPLYEVPQDIDSPLFLGSYNWAFFVVVGFFLMSAFAVYTFWPRDFEEPIMIEHSLPSSYFGRLGIAWIVVPILMVFFCVVVAMLVAFRIGGNWPSTMTNVYPTTVSTNVVVCTFAIGTLLHFLSELAERPGKSKEQHPYAVMPEAQAHLGFFGLAAPGPRPGYAALAAEPRTAESKAQEAEAVTPSLMVAWADAYLMDALIFTGLVGATLQVETDDVYNLFWGLVAYRVAGMAVARIVFEAYIKNPADSDDLNSHKGTPVYPKNNMPFVGAFTPDPYRDAANAQAYSAKFPNRRAVASAKIQALLIHVASVLALTSVLVILFNGNRIYSEFGVLYWAAILCLLVPEAIRFLGHVFVAVRAGDNTLAIALGVQSLWLWDILTRFIFVCIVYWDGGADPGTRAFLTSNSQNLTASIKFLTAFP